ncbi:MAG: hypothetical protein M1832_005902 [Thelocarpon impressellum]|nr:MAG: hypothetical protein M1832_005902 [Thelocarpon impressellum]
MSPSGLCLLPAELRLCILKALPDTASLRSLILASSSFYRSYVDAASLVVPAVVRNEIPASVLPHAEATWAASRLPPRSVASLRAFLADYSPYRELRSLPLTLTEALEWSRLHDHVRHFADDFGHSVLSSHPSHGESEACLPYIRPLSDAEAARFSRAFYWVELYYNLVRQDRPRVVRETHLTSKEQQEGFFDKFAPWELEQMGCARDYLDRKLSVAVDDLLEDEVEWGEEMNWRNDDTRDIGTLWKEKVMAGGLALVRRLVRADTYDERAVLLKRAAPYDSDYLTDGLWDEFFGGFGRDHGLNPAAPPFADEDSGPYDSWRRELGGREDRAAARYYYEDTKATERECGYCLWDRWRLDAWGPTGMPWHPDEVRRRREGLSEARERRGEP